MTSVDEVDEEEKDLGVVTDQEKFATNVKGAWVRPSTKFHEKVTAEESTFKAEKGRYHVYYSDACPWYADSSSITDSYQYSDSTNSQ